MGSNDGVLHSGLLSFLSFSIPDNGQGSNNPVIPIEITLS
jgi:hypothetical protein